jgi:uncharacterized membrane protein (UPF0127 family)
MKILFILLVLLISFIVFKNLNPSKESFVSVKGKSFSVDVAKTDYEKQKGLSIYSSLPKERGMIFLFDTKDYHAFWMKDMKFAIDIIYINGDEIVDLFENVPSPKKEGDNLPIITPKEKADKVFEINAGLSKKYGFKKGDRVEINLK